MLIVPAIDRIVSVTYATWYKRCQCAATFKGVLIALIWQAWMQLYAWLSTPVWTSWQFHDKSSEANRTCQLYNISPSEALITLSILTWQSYALESESRKLGRGHHGSGSGGIWSAFHRFALLGTLHLDNPSYFQKTLMLSELEESWVKKLQWGYQLFLCKNNLLPYYSNYNRQLWAYCYFLL